MKTEEVYKLETAPVEKEPRYMLASEHRTAYKRDESYQPEREFQEPLPGEEDEELPQSVSAAKIALCQKVHDLQCEIFTGFGVNACQEFAQNKVEHIIEAVQTKDNSCPLCHKSLKDGLAVKSHLRAKHQQATPFKCEICDKFLADSQLLKSHLKTHSDANKFKCTHPGCDKGYPTKGRLNSHLKTHNPDTHSNCKYCGKVIKEKKNLKPHEKTCKLQPGGREAAVKDKVCPYCPKAFYHQKDLKYHLDHTHASRAKEKS